MNTIGFIGSGNMAEAIIKGVIASGMYQPQDIMASDVRQERLAAMASQYQIKTTQNNDEVVQFARILMLCVKPQQIRPLLESIQGKTHPDTVVISIAAGITTDVLSKGLAGCQVIRVMPNTPAMVGQGAAAIFSANASKQAVEHTVKLFSAVGRVVIVDKEELIDAVTAVSGSGPAYFFYLMEQMIEAGVRLGLSPEASSQLVLQTASGAALLAQNAANTGQTPAQLRKNVTSPGGTTEAAIKTFTSRGMDGIIQSALTAAYDRSRQLSQG